VDGWHWSLSPVLCVGAVDPLVGVSVLIRRAVPLGMAKREPEVSTISAPVKPVPFTAGVYVTGPTKVDNGVAAGGFGWTSHGQSIVVLDASALRLFADMGDGNLS